MWDKISVVIAGLVSFLSIVGVLLPQWVTRRYKALDFGGRLRVGLLEYASEYSGYISRDSRDYVYLKGAYYELVSVLELLAIFFSFVVFFLLFLKVFMGKSDKKVHIGAIVLSTLAGILMILGPFVFCYLAEFNTYENRPETVGKSMFICVFAGVISIGNALLLGCFYLHDNCNTVQDLDEVGREPCIEQQA